MARTPSETVDAIVATNREIASFWSNAQGWAPLEAAELLSKSRLDWQVELSEMLHTWIAVPEASTANGHLILGYANLGALVEGSLKWFLSVYYDDYKSDVDALKNKHGDIVSPDGQTLEPLRQFYRKRIWDAADPWFDWVLRIQQRRNAIHAFKNRNLGTHPEFLDDVSFYFDLVSELNGRAPYPDFS